MNQQLVSDPTLILKVKKQYFYRSIHLTYFTPFPVTKFTCNNSKHYCTKLLFGLATQSNIWFQTMPNMILLVESTGSSRAQRVIE